MQIKKFFLKFLIHFSLIFVFNIPFCRAEEQVTITTYYPAPIGVFLNLQTNSMAVGSNTPMPTTNGELTWGGGGSSAALLTSQGGSLQVGGPGTQPYIESSNGTRIEFDNLGHLLFKVGDRVQLRSPDGSHRSDLWVGCIYYHFPGLPVAYYCRTGVVWLGVI